MMRITTRTRYTALWDGEWAFTPGVRGTVVTEFGAYVVSSYSQAREAALQWVEEATGGPLRDAGLTRGEFNGLAMFIQSVGR